MSLPDTFANRAMLREGLEAWRLVERGRWLIAFGLWKLKR